MEKNIDNEVATGFMGGTGRKLKIAKGCGNMAHVLRLHIDNNARADLLRPEAVPPERLAIIYRD